MRRETPAVPETGPPCWRCGAATVPTHPEVQSAAAVFACCECRAALWKAYANGGYRPMTWKEFRETAAPARAPALKQIRARKVI